MDTTDEMTEPVEPVEPVDEAPEAGEPDPAGQPDEKHVREAAKYRRQLREAQAENADLHARLEALQRAEVTRLAGERLTDGADLFRYSDGTVADYLADDGTIDPAKVTAAVDEITGSRGYLARRLTTGAADGGARADQQRHDDVTWQRLLNGA